MSDIYGCVKRLVVGVMLVNVLVIVLGQGGCKNVGGCGVSDCSDVCVRVSDCSVGGWLCW